MSQNISAYLVQLLLALALAPLLPGIINRIDRLPDHLRQGQ